MINTMQAALGSGPRYESITPLLKKLARLGQTTDPIQPDEIAEALYLLLDDKLTDTQSAALLSLLHQKKKDQDTAIIGESLRCIIQPKIDEATLQQVISTRRKPEGNYLGGLCELAGTGGNATSTLASVAATASFIASPFLLVCQHGYMGANSPTPSMGNDLILASINPAPPALSNITPKNIAEVLKESNYAFLPEPNFYPTMKHANSIREGLGIRTIFDLISTLVHPIQGHIEARVIGVPNPDLGPALAEALRDTGVKKALVVSGHGSIDQISPEGGTSCWMFSDSDTAIQHFQLQPSDFGLLERPLDTVKARVRGVLEEAATLVDILQGRLLDVDPVLQFVLIHAAALLVTSGVCDTDVSEKLGRKADVIKERGPGGQRWKEGLRRAKWSIESGEAHKILETYVRVTSQL